MDLEGYTMITIFHWLTKCHFECQSVEKGFSQILQKSSVSFLNPREKVFNFGGKNNDYNNKTKQK